MTPPTAPAPVPVRYEYTDTLVPLLRRIRASLLVSTYQAGKLIAVGVTSDGLHLGFHAFDRPMGVAVGPRLAVGTRNAVYYLDPAPALAPQIEPAGRYDGAYLARSAHVTGPVRVHELA